MKNFLDLIEKIDKKRIIVGVVGLPGSGKSTILKNFRKNGIKNLIKPYQIAVIDDLVMSINLFFCRPKYKNKSALNYKPFFRFIPPWVKVIFITNPKNLEFVDICLKILVDEQKRINFLKNREKKDKLSRYVDTKDIKINFSYDYLIELDYENFNN